QAGRGGFRPPEVGDAAFDGKREAGRAGFPQPPVRGSPRRVFGHWLSSGLRPAAAGSMEPGARAVHGVVLDVWQAVPFFKASADTALLRNLTSPLVMVRIPVTDRNVTAPSRGGVWL